MLLSDNTPKPSTKKHKRINYENIWRKFNSWVEYWQHLCAWNNYNHRRRLIAYNAYHHRPQDALLIFDLTTTSFTGILRNRWDSYLIEEMQITFKSNYWGYLELVIILLLVCWAGPMRVIVLVMKLWSVINHSQDKRRLSHAGTFRTFLNRQYHWLQCSLSCSSSAFSSCHGHSYHTPFLLSNCSLFIPHS